VALSDAEREKNIPRKRNRAIDAKSNFRWSDKQKLEAVSSYLALGNLALTSRVLGIPEVTLRVWKASEWWKNAVEEVRLQEKIVLSNRMKSLVDAAQVIVAQRLEQGDPVMSPKGEIVYKPVSMKDAHKVATDLIDRKAVLDKTTVDAAPQEESNTQTLEKLAERFAAMATKSIEKQFNNKRTIDVTDVEEISSAVHEERETRLQDGVPEISFEAGTDQEPDSEDDRPQAG
jgi:hypothetical protein